MAILSNPEVFQRTNAGLLAMYFRAGFEKHPRLTNRLAPIPLKEPWKKVRNSLFSVRVDQPEGSAFIQAGCVRREHTPGSFSSSLSDLYRDVFFDVFHCFFGSLGGNTSSMIQFSQGPFTVLLSLNNPLSGCVQTMYISSHYGVIRVYFAFDRLSNSWCVVEKDGVVDLYNKFKERVKFKMFTQGKMPTQGTVTGRSSGHTLSSLNHKSFPANFETFDEVYDRLSKELKVTHHP